MKLGSYNLGDFFADVPLGDPSGAAGQPEFIGTADAFVKPLLQLIQRFYTYNNLFDIDNNEDSPMMIGGKFTYSRTQWGAVPTVVVLRGPITRTPEPLLQARESVNPLTGAMTYKRRYMSNVQVLCISTEVAESTATQIFDLLDQAPREVAMSGITRLEGLTLGTEERLEGGAIEGLKICTVSCKITTEKRWTETPSNRTTLNEVNINGLC
jgi:hypothetical protein